VVEGVGGRALGRGDGVGGTVGEVLEKLQMALDEGVDDMEGVLELLEDVLEERL
jgi:hypothetical protein